MLTAHYIRQTMGDNVRNEPFQGRCSSWFRIPQDLIHSEGSEWSEPSGSHWQGWQRLYPHRTPKTQHHDNGCTHTVRLKQPWQRLYPHRTPKTQHHFWQRLYPHCMPKPQHHDNSCPNVKSRSTKWVGCVYNSCNHAVCPKANINTTVAPESTRNKITKWVEHWTRWFSAHEAITLP